MQVISDSAAESEAAAQHDMERAYVAVPVTASLEQVYNTIKVNSQQCGEVCCLYSQAGDDCIVGCHSLGCVKLSAFCYAASHCMSLYCCV